MALRHYHVLIVSPRGETRALPNVAGSHSDVVGVPTARAVTLDSPMLGNTTGSQLVCRVVNVGQKDAMVTAQLLNTSGTNIATTTFSACNATIPLVPHQSCTVSRSGSIFARCNVTSTSSKIRATLARDIGGVAQVVVPVTK